MTVVLLFLGILNASLTAALYFHLVREGKPKSVRLSSPPSKEDFETAVAEVKSILNDASEWLEIEKAARKPKPIHHDKVTGPTSAKAAKNIGYWIPKDKPDGPPFLAQWYKEGSFPSTRDVLFESYSLLPIGYTKDMTIPPDRYVDEAGVMLSGHEFRELYVEAPAIMTVGKAKFPTHNNPQVRLKSSIQLSPEEEEKLAEEYELGKPPVELTDEQREFIKSHTHQG
jgi:hypothetical protein